MTFLYEFQLLTNSYTHQRSQNQDFWTAQPSLEIAFGNETESIYEFQLLINSYVSQSSQNWHFFGRVNLLLRLLVEQKWHPCMISSSS